MKNLCDSVYVYTTLHISSLKLQQAKSSFLTASRNISFCYMAKKLCPKQECYFFTVFKKWVSKVKGLVEIVRESHIPNSQ